MGGNYIYIKDTQDASQPLILYGLFHGNLLFLIKSKPNAFSKSSFLVESKPSAYTNSKPAFFTKSNAFITKLKPNAFTKSNLIAYSHWHKVFIHINTFAQNKSFYKDGEILPNFIKYNF